MAELNLGTKFECYNCGTRFYDLGKPEALCPKCGANQKDADRSEGPAAPAARRKRKAVDIGKPVALPEVDDVPIEDLPEEDLEGAGLDADLDADEDEEEDLDDDET